MVATVYYPNALTLGAEALTSIKRIEQYMLKEEKHIFGFRLERRNSPNELILNQPYNAIEIHGASAIWDQYSKQLTLEHIDLNIQPGRLYAIIGPVGAGKVNTLNVSFRFITKIV